jgi:hypothetical protein
MAHCGSFGEAGRLVGVEDMDEALIAMELEHAFGEDPVVSLTAEDVPNEGAAVRMHYFGSLTIIVGKIKEMEEKGYFVKDEACAHGAETMPEPRADETMVFEDFFVAGLCMPSHPALSDSLLHFQA